MNIHEFELRYRAYKWLNHKFNFDRDHETILDMTKISNRWILKKPVQEINPEELHEITLETYTQFKKDFLDKNKETQALPIGRQVWFGTLIEYIDRLEYELKVIKEMWFNSYFLIVADFVRRAKKNNIVVWPWRGSWAWSLLARVIRITDIDPLQFWLLFERFLNPARVSMPDFDIDFEDVQRDKVIQYVQQKYWEDQVSAIWTYMQMATKAAFKDAARTLWVPFDKSNHISWLIPDRITISQAINSEDGNEELKSIYNSDEKIQQAIQLSSRLEWNMRQLGMHACGIIIAPQKITKYSPIQHIKEDDTTTVSQYDWPTLEIIWLLKMDFLWLRNLSVIKNCIRIIKKRHEKEWIILPEMFQKFFEDTSFQPPIDDNFTFESVFKTGNTTWIFQFESDGMRRFLVKLQCDSINDLVAMNALYRPWPMEFIPNYIDRKNWKEPISYMHQELRQIITEKYWEEIADQENMKLVEDLAPIMNLTYWIAVYQEQLMFLVQAMAWFSLAEADNLRRGVGKKKKEIIEKIKKEFIKKCKEFRDYKKETAQYIYEKMIEPAASYSFNKSHSVCYSMIAYQTAYLKAHYPIEFYASLIRSVQEDIDELSNYIYEAQQQWITVLSPNINQSFNNVAAIWDNIRLWFFCIKWLWFEIWETLQEERKKSGPYKDLQDLLKRCTGVINKKSLEWLIKSWALDNFGDRGTLLSNSDSILEWTKRSKEIWNWLFGSMDSTSQITLKNPRETSMMEKIMMEQDVFKAFVSWNPLDWLYLYLKKYNFISQFKENDTFGNFTILGHISNIQRAKKKWFFIGIEDISWNIEFFVKDILDFKKFDILIVSWFKGKAISLEKIIRTSRENLIRQAGSKYNESITVVKAKSMRLRWDKSINWENNSNDILNEAKNISQKKSFEFSLPDNISKLNEVLKIVNNYQWDIQVKLWQKNIWLNTEWIRILQDLLS